MKTNYPFSVWSIDGVGGGITLGLQHSSPSQPKSTQPRVLATCKAVISSLPIVSFLQICKQIRASTYTALWKAAFPQTKKIQETAAPQYFILKLILFWKCKTVTMKKEGIFIIHLNRNSWIFMCFWHILIQQILSSFLSEQQ